MMASSSSSTANSKLFTVYIGACYTGVKFTDIPINKKVHVNFLLSFAIDYSTSPSSPNPTNGNFNIFWDYNNLSIDHLKNIKKNYPNNVSVGLSLGGDSVYDEKANFMAQNIESWVNNAVFSLTKIIKDYDLDGIDINYEHFISDRYTFVQCIGRLIKRLKEDKVVKYVSIAPYNHPTVQNYYKDLWNSNYKKYIDYVNFQFYAYENITEIKIFLEYFEEQRNNYQGGKILVSYSSYMNHVGGLARGESFIEACRELKQQNKLYGVFFWCADHCKSRNDFTHEEAVQKLLED